MTKLELQQRLNAATDELVALRAEVSRLKVQLDEAQRNKTQPEHKTRAEHQAALLAQAKALAMAGKKCVIRGSELVML